jgi:hypothetical protein
VQGGLTAPLQAPLLSRHVEARDGAPRNRRSPADGSYAKATRGSSYVLLLAPDERILPVRLIWYVSLGGAARSALESPAPRGVRQDEPTQKSDLQLGGQLCEGRSVRGTTLIEPQFGFARVDIVARLARNALT